MHRVDTDGNVSGLFTDGDPDLAEEATVVDDDWLNDMQENVAQAVEAASISLVKGTYTQLTTAIGVLARIALQAAANTWAQLQTFSKGAVVTTSTTNGQGVHSTGNGGGAGLYGEGGATGQGVYGKGGASGAPGGEFEGTSGAAALYAFSTATNIAVATIDGYVDLSGGANPPSSGSVGNNPGKLSKKHVSAAWGTFGLTGSTSSGTSVLVSTDALNVSSAVMRAGYVEVTVSTPMAHGQCLVPHLTTSATGATGQVGVQWTSTTVVRLKLFESNGTSAIDLTGADLRQMILSFTVQGEQ